MPPLKPRKSSKTAVERNPLTAQFQCKSRVVGIGNKIAAGLRFAAESSEDTPVVRPRSKHANLFAHPKILEKFQRSLKRGWHFKNFWVSYHAQAAAQHQLRNRHARRRLKLRFKPSFDLGMAIGVLPVRVNRTLTSSRIIALPSLPADRRTSKDQRRVARPRRGTFSKV
jgi:hypothetical protein